MNSNNSPDGTTTSDLQHSDAEGEDSEEFATPRELIDAAEEAYICGNYDEALLATAVAMSQLDDESDEPDRIDDAAGDPKLVAAALRIAAGAHQGNGDHVQATELCERALRVAEMSGDEGFELASILSLRAHLHLHQDELDVAMPLLNRAAEIFEANKRTTELDSVLITMAEVSFAVDDPESAKQLFGRALEDLSDCKPTSDLHAKWLNGLTAKAFFGLAGSALRLGETAEASDYLARSIEFFEAAHGRGHPALLEALSGVAQIYRLLEDESAAEAIEAEIEAQGSQPSELPPEADE